MDTQNESMERTGERASRIIELEVKNCCSRLLKK